MLKRNDEKSAEYFAHYSTGNASASENDGDNTNSRRDFENHSNYNGNHQYNSNKKVLNQKTNSKSEDASSNSVHFGSDYSHQLSHSSDLSHVQNFQQQQLQNQKDYLKKGNQNFGSGAAVPSVQQQQQHKFNRAPGGGKPLQHNHQTQISKNSSGTNNVVQIASSNSGFNENNGNGNTGAKVSDSTTMSKSTVALAALPSDNVWEKRKEERQSLEPKTTQQV